MTFLETGAARAQVGNADLVLNDETPVYNLAPHIFITPDPDHAISLKTMYEHYTTGQRGEQGRGDVIPLGAAATPYWMILEVENRSWSDRWVMTFGQHMTGRLGLLRQVYLYDLQSQTRYLDNISSTHNPYIGPQGEGYASVPVTIPRGHAALFFLYVVPLAGQPATLAPRLMTEGAFADMTTSPLSPARLFNLSLVLATGFLLAAAFFSRSWSVLFFLGWYAVQIVAFNCRNTILYTDMPGGSDLAAALTAAGAIAALLTTKFFLPVGRVQRRQNRLLWLFMIAVAACTGLAILLVPRDSGLFILLTFLPGLATGFFLFFLSLAQAYSGTSSASYEFAFGWLVWAVGGVLSLLGAMNILPASTLIISAGWESLIPQALLFTVAVARRATVMSQEDYLEAAAQVEDNALTVTLRQTREVAENSRLLRLIEHERLVMNELRARESQQSEDMRTALDAADQANRAKSAFLAVISHEIRTPMTGIMGMVRLLLDTALSKDQADYAQTIQDSGDAMLSLLNDILDFEKIESGKMDLEHLDFDLHRTVQGIVTLMSGHAAAKKITLKFEMDPGVPRYVVGDPVRLRQVLLNLTGNSIKFTGQGGVTLRVRVENAAGTMASPGVHRLQFNVEDTGIGISPEAQKNLFNPFSQADSSVARKFGGTGLGLAISQRLIEAMGGKIRIDSTPGQGSTFYFSLDMKEGSADGIQGRQSLSAGAKPERALDILIVEDNEINQKLLKEFIDRFGHRTAQAGSGEAALELLQSRGFDMILMDIELPGLSGMGTTKAIRALPNRARAATPVIALTGNVRDEDVRAAYAANMNGHLAKPVDPKRLKTMIEKVGKGDLDNPVELAEPAAPRPAITVVTAPAPSSPPPENEGMAPIRELALGLGHLSFSDDELDTDSFSEALDKIPAEPVEAVSSADATFDAAMLDSLRTGMTPAQLRDLMQGFFDKLDELLVQLRLDADGDMAGFVAHAHELKGMAGNFGLREIQHVTAEAEQDAKTGRLASLPDHLAALNKARGRAGGAIDHWLAQS